MSFGSMASSRSQRAEAPQVAVVVGDIDEAVAAAAAGCRLPEQPLQCPIKTVRSSPLAEPPGRNNLWFHDDLVPSSPAPDSMDDLVQQDELVPSSIAPASMDNLVPSSPAPSSMDDLVEEDELVSSSLAPGSMDDLVPSSPAPVP
jgi:hypothetical protein